MVEQTKKEIDGAIKEAGEQAAFDLGVHGIDSELIKVDVPSPDILGDVHLLGS